MDHHPASALADQPAGSIPGRIVTTLRERITAGQLAPGDPVEATRTLARALGVSRGSVVAAYEQLIGEGYLVATPAGTRVNPALPIPARPTPKQPPAAPRPRLRGDLRPGAPDTSALTSDSWRAAWRRAAADPTATYPPEGSPRLREQLAEHLRTTRAVLADPADIVVTSGARDGLRLLLLALGARQRIAVENPGYPSLRSVPAALGHEVTPALIDAHGIRADELRRLDPTVVLLTPNHLYPHGTQMPAARRWEVLEWAAERGALIIEDDYDSETRRAHPPLISMATGGQAAMLGSFAKTLTPALGLGFVVVPPALRRRVLDLALPVSGIVQDAMGEFLAADGLRRHTARMRREYRRRARIFSEVFPAGHPMDGGLHAIIPLADAHEHDIIARARRAGLAVEGAGHYWAGDAGAAGEEGIVVGLGAHHAEKLRALLVELRGMIA